MNSEAADVVIQALDVTSNTVLVFNTDKPVPVTEVWNIRKALSERGLNPLILINDASWGWDLEKLPPNQLHMLHDMLVKKFADDKWEGKAFNGPGPLPDVG